MGVAVGIDLGTSNSCVAFVKDGQPVVLADEEGHHTQPSVVTFGRQGSVIVGQRARKNLIYAPQNTVASAKRLIGRRYASDTVQRFISQSAFEVVEGPHGDARVKVQGRVYAVPEISAQILRRMKEVAERALGQTVDKAVITVPAYFNDHQRQATKDAAAIAGLECLRIVNEPTAAALAYGFNRGKRQHIVVYDLGGGTFDVSVLRLDGDVVEVVATAGDTFLGGDDFDYAVGDHLLRVFKQRTGIDLTGDRTARLKLRDAAERAKIALSNAESVDVRVPALTTGPSGEDIGLDLRLSRGEYDQIVHPLVQRTFQVCDDALSQARMSAAQVDHVLLVGGMTRVPAVRHAVAIYFNKPPYADLNPDEIVAVGAAIQAANLDQDDINPTVLLDVTPQSLGIRTVGGFCEILIPRNTTIPAESSKVFHTVRDGQDHVKISVYQGESRMAADNELLGQFVLEGLPAGARGEVRIEVSFEIDANGIVQVSARDLVSGQQKAIRIEASSGLTQEEVRSARFDQVGF